MSARYFTPFDQRGGVGSLTVCWAYGTVLRFHMGTAGTDAQPLITYPLLSHPLISHPLIRLLPRTACTRRSLRRSDHRPGAVRPLGGAVRGEALQGHTGEPRGPSHLLLRGLLSVLPREMPQVRVQTGVHPDGHPREQFLYGMQRRVLHHREVGLLCYAMLYSWVVVACRTTRTAATRTSF